MRILCSTQLTNEWFEARCGKVTGSNVWKVMKRMKVNRGEKKVGDSSEEREKYKDVIIGEILSGLPNRNFVSQWMDEGRENEPLARTAYEQLFDCEIKQTGFVLHPNLDRFGASPDGVLPGGCVEFKCPASNTHSEYMRRKVIPPDYIDQMQAEIVCAEADWCDFVSYCPNMKPPFDLYRVRVGRDNKRIAEIEYAVIEFMDEVLKDIERTADMLQGKSEFKRQLKQSVMPERTEEEEYLSAVQAVEDGIGLVP